MMYKVNRYYVRAKFCKKRWSIYVRTIKGWNDDI